MKKLRRYTNIPALIDIIHNQALTLLSPNNWTDQNDVYAMSQYKIHSTKKLSTLLALCFTEADEETFHHWNVFAGDSSGVCVVFKRDALIEPIEGKENFRHGAITYINNNDSQFDRYKIDALPFIKRSGYNDEREYRIIFEHSSEFHSSIRILIDMSSIEEIVFSPKIPDPLLSSALAVISKMDNIKNCDIPMRKSLLTDDFAWKCRMDAIAHPGTKPEDHARGHLLKAMLNR